LASGNAFALRQAAKLSKPKRQKQQHKPKPAPAAAAPDHKQPSTSSAAATPARTRSKPTAAAQSAAAFDVEEDVDSWAMRKGSNNHSTYRHHMRQVSLLQYCSVYV
jgi:hypothetical protein